jgi:eukaryotic-like serine/threonine-protein kinase
MNNETEKESFTSEPASEATTKIAPLTLISNTTTLDESFTSAAPGIPPGHFIGNYELVREIGRGGMGTVYRAERADDEFHKQVAIKLIRRSLCDDSVIRRFRTERQILAMFDHPNIARFFDAGVTEAGDPYCVMELVEGAPIDEYCDDHRLSVTDRLKLFREVCSAVHYAHQNLIIHRDLKPNNILITKDGRVKLLDFGIARVLNPDHFLQTVEQTIPGYLVMTPQYASPEQANGETLTTSSDVCSLGVILYELLTGHRPYHLDKRRPKDIIRIICEEEPSRPSTAITREVEIVTTHGLKKITPESVSAARAESPERLRRRLADELDNIVLMALRKEPQRRYGSPEQLSEDIRRYLEGRPVRARKDTFGYRARKFIKRNRLGVAAASLIALSMVSGIAVTAWQARIARGAQQYAETQRANAEAQRQRAEAALARAESEEERAKDALEEAKEQRWRAEKEKAIADEQRGRATSAQAIAEAQRVRAESALAQAEIQRARAEKRFNDVRNLANTLIFDLHEKIQNLPGSTPARETLLRTATEYLDNLARDAGDNRELQFNLANAYQRLGQIQGMDGLANLGDRKSGLQSYQKSLSILKALAEADPSDTKAQRELGGRL